MGVIEQPTVEVVSLIGQQWGEIVEKISCKFVVIARAAHYVMILGDLSRYPYHANLLDEYGRRFGITRHWVRQPDQLQIDNPEFRVLGGGYVEVGVGGRRIRIYGSSKAYGYFDLEAVQRIAGDPRSFDGAAVSIET